MYHQLKSQVSPMAKTDGKQKRATVTATTTATTSTMTTTAKTTITTTRKKRKNIADTKRAKNDPDCSKHDSKTIGKQLGNNSKMALDVLNYFLFSRSLGAGGSKVEELLSW